MPRRAVIAFAAAAGCVLALAAAWAATFGAHAARWLDAAALQGFVGLRRAGVEAVAESAAAVGDPLPFVLLGAALAAVALARGRPRVALAVPVVLAGSAVTTQVLKPLLAHPRVCHCLGDARVDLASWPSGHATAAMSLALCAVLVAPPRLRPTAAVAGAGLAVAVSYALLTLGWHYPSDVLAGYLVAAAWTALTLGALWAAGARWPARTGREAAARWGAVALPALAGALLAALFFALAALARPLAALDYAAAHPTFVAVAGAIALSGAALAGGLAAVLRR